jgi:lysophospholipase
MVTDARVRRNEGSIVGVGQLRLRYRTWEAAGARAGILVVHGLGEHSGRYESFASRMAYYGFSTFAMDMRGHGLSDGRRGHVPRFNALLQDLDRFRREVHGFAESRMPLFVLGHSLGGLVALRYQEEYQDAFPGAVVISPWLATSLPVPRWKVTLANVVAPLLPALPVHNGIDPTYLSHDPDIVRAYRADPLVHGRITPRFFTEAASAMGLVTQRADRLTDPILFLVAGDDRLVVADKSLRFAHRLPPSLTTIRHYPGMYHEVLNEVDRHLPMRDIRDWITARVDDV